MLMLVTITPCKDKRVSSALPELNLRYGKRAMPNLNPRFGKRDDFDSVEGVLWRSVIDALHNICACVMLC